MGQLVARFAKLTGSSRIFVADVSDERLAKIPDDPCITKINSRKESVPEIVLQNTVRNEGAAVVFEATSVPSLIPEQLTCLRTGGKLIITSSPKGLTTVDFDYVSRRYLTIIGAHNVTSHTKVEMVRDRWTMARDKAYFLELLEKKQVTVAEMLTHFDSYKNAIALYELLMKDRTKALSVCMNWED